LVASVTERGVVVLDVVEDAASDVVVTAPLAGDEDAPARLSTATTSTAVTTAIAMSAAPKARSIAGRRGGGSGGGWCDPVASAGPGSTCGVWSVGSSQLLTDRRVPAAGDR
jgi:hypothetical protein